MVGFVVLVSTALFWQDPPLVGPPAPTPPSVAASPGSSPKAEADAAEAKALAEYNTLREKTPQTAAAQWKLAVWCETAGLKPEAYVHFGRVIELDPRRDAAWEKLGFKKRAGGHRMTDEQVAAQAAEKKADKEWALRLKKLHKEIHGDRKRDHSEAQAELDKLIDPKAVPSIYREFAGGGRKDQEIAVRLLGQVDSPVASKALAMLAVYGKHPDVRRGATETLRGRPSSEFLDLLVAMMQDPIRHEVRPVGGPGSPGVLLIEGDRFNTQRIYAPPPPPGFNIRPGDTITYDQYGMPVVSRSESHHLGTSKVGVKGSKSLVNETDVTETTTETFSFSNAIIEARKGAAYAEAQLAADLKRVEAINDRRKQITDMIRAVARGATGKDLGPTSKDARKALEGQDGRYAATPRRERLKPTVADLVPLDYVPNIAAIMTIQRQTQALTQIVVDS